MGGGLWYAAHDPRNSSIRLPSTHISHAAGDLAAILLAVWATPVNTDLHIVCSSPYPILCLTRYLPQWESRDWIDAPDRDIIETAASFL